jgi:hypothetical protein
MKFVPRHNDVVGRYLLAREPEESLIVRPGDGTQDTTKFLLIDAVGPEAEMNGLKVGDIVVVDKVWSIKLNGGAIVRAHVPENNCREFADDVPLSTFVVQTDNGKKFVPFDHPEAAKAIGGKRTTGNGSAHHDVTGAPA